MKAFTGRVDDDWRRILAVAAVNAELAVVAVPCCTAAAALCGTGECKQEYWN